MRALSLLLIATAASAVLAPNPTVADQIALDVDPKHPDADSYQVDCTRGDVRAPRATLGHLTLDRRGGVKLTFVVRAGKVYLSSIHQMTPCEV